MQKRSKRNPPHQGRGTGRTREDREFVRSSEALIRIPRAPRGSNYIQPMVRTELVWSLNGTLNNAAALGANTYVQANYLTVPQLSASTTPGGLSDLADLYCSARVLKVRVEFSATNLESFPLTMWICNVGESQTTGVVPTANDITSVALIRRVTENRSSHTYQLGQAASKPAGKVFTVFSLKKYLQTKWSGAADDYTMTSTGGSTLLGSPVQLLYVGYGIYSTNASTVLVNGCAYQIKVYFDTVFFGPRNQAS